MLAVRGKRLVSYAADETPMAMYANLHAALEERRAYAASNQNAQAPSADAAGDTSALEVVTCGPVVMIVGPTDVGKSSLSKILVNYAVRVGRKPIFVDLDVGQGAVTIPGMFAAVQLERPVTVESGISSATAPLVYFYGHNSPGENAELYRAMLQRMSATIQSRLRADKDSSAGVVVNTCGWVEGLGYQLLVDSVRAMRADVVVVLGHERLYNDLASELAESEVEVVKLPKSGGTVTRDTSHRRKGRMNMIREYFYGPQAGLCPISKVVYFNEVSIYRIGGGPQAPSSALPIGAAPSVDPIRLMEVQPSASLLHCVLGVSHATSVDDTLDTNVAGFLYVTEVDAEKMVVLAPSPGPMPGKILLLGTLKWHE